MPTNDSELTRYSINAIPTTYAGILFRSRLEATWAAFFDQLGWQWQYEPVDYPGWIPDFGIRSDYHGLILVEVKPVADFDEEVAKKIDDACQDREVLLLGIGPFYGAACSGPFLGWLRETDFYTAQTGTMQVFHSCGRAPCGLWLGSESEKKNPKEIIGFCHEEQRFTDRITGCYDGGCWGEGAFCPNDVLLKWAEAKNTTAWRKPRSHSYKDAGVL